MGSLVWLKKGVVIYVVCICMHGIAYPQGAHVSELIDKHAHDAATVLWYDGPAERWEHALPVGNGRLGAMVLGKYGEERIQFNEETLWSGGPYNTVVKGGANVLPKIQQLIFEGKPIGGDFGSAPAAMPSSDVAASSSPVSSRIHKACPRPGNAGPDPRPVCICS